MSFGTRLKHRREELELTQTELAKLIGISKGAIGNYETQVSSPKTEILFKLFDILKCDANYLFQDDIKIQHEKSLTIREEKHIKKYRHLDNSGKETVDFILDKEYQRATKESNEQSHMPETIAAHHETGEFSEADKSDINRFLEIVKKNSNK